MQLSEKWGIELVTIWVEKSVGSQESFGYLISDFLNEHPSIINRDDVESVLLAAKKLAAKVIAEHPDDVPLNLSYKAFSSALDHFIGALG